MTDALRFEAIKKYYRADRAISFRTRLRHAAGKVLNRDVEHRLVKALDDVSFSVPVGESFAIIGDNGAGKTTALKIATRIAHPTSGTASIRGRIGALIEVGTGMHPELTGRENISLYGRILGL